MDSAHEVQDRQGIENAQPHGCLGRDAAALSQAHESPAGKRQPEHRHGSVKQHCPKNLVLSNPGNNRAVSHGDWTIRRRGVAPHQRHGACEGILCTQQIHGTCRIGIPSARADGALCQVRVNILGEQGSREDQRQYPQTKGAPQHSQRNQLRSPLRSLYAEPGEKYPGNNQHRNSEEHQHGGGVQHAVQKHHHADFPPEVFYDRPGAGAPTAHGNHEGTDGAEDHGDAQAQLVRGAHRPRGSLVRKRRAAGPVLVQLRRARTCLTHVRELRFQCAQRMDGARC